MPAAAFVAGAAVQNAHNASLIAQQAATVAEQQTLEANQARHYASFVEAQATQALQQAEATLLETRAKAEAYVAQAEANVRNTRQQAQAFAASVDQEREQFQAQLNSINGPGGLKLMQDIASNNFNTKLSNTCQLNRTQSVTYNSIMPC